MAAKASGKNDPDRTPDRLAAGLAFAFIVLLLATELVLTLPDEADSPSHVAQFYTQHRAFIIALQIWESLTPYCWEPTRGDYVQSTDSLPGQAY